jgi:hypothetical protein
VEVRGEVAGEHDDGAGILGAVAQEEGVDGLGEVGLVPSPYVSGQQNPTIQDGSIFRSVVSYVNPDRSIIRHHC